MNISSVSPMWRAVWEKIGISTRILSHLNKQSSFLIWKIMAELVKTEEKKKKKAFICIVFLSSAPPGYQCEETSMEWTSFCGNNHHHREVFVRKEDKMQLCWIYNWTNNYYSDVSAVWKIRDSELWLLCLNTGIFPAFLALFFF